MPCAASKYFGESRESYAAHRPTAWRLRTSRGRAHRDTSEPRYVRCDDRDLTSMKIQHSADSAPESQPNAAAQSQTGSDSPFAIEQSSPSGWSKTLRPEY